MRSRSVLMLASVAMILVATGIGNAFAYSWPGTAASAVKWTGSNYAAVWESTPSQTNPTVGQNEQLYWQNSLSNKYRDTLYADLLGYLGLGSGSYEAQSTVTYGQPAWTQEGSLSSGTYSWNNLNILHSYGWIEGRIDYQTSVYQLDFTE